MEQLVEYLGAARISTQQDDIARENISLLTLEKNETDRCLVRRKTFDSMSRKENICSDVLGLSYFISKCNDDEHKDRPRLGSWSVVHCSLLNKDIHLLYLRPNSFITMAAYFVGLPTTKKTVFCTADTLTTFVIWFCSDNNELRCGDADISIAPGNDAGAARARPEGLFWNDSNSCLNSLALSDNWK